MAVTRFGLKRPVSACMIIIAIAVFGIVSLFGFSTDLLPELETPVLMVRTAYEGADPETVDTTVSQLIEQTAETLNGVRTITSNSYEDYSVVTLRYDYGSDMTFHYMKLQNALAEAKRELPAEAGEPVIVEMDMDTQPTMEIAAHGTDEKEILAFLNEGMLTELENLPSVAKVEVFGGKTNYIQIKLKENLLNQYGLTMEQVAEYIGAADFDVPIGSVSQGKQTLDVSSSASRDTLEEIKEIPLKGEDGGLIRLEDIADVSWNVKDAESISHFNGEENVTIRVTKSTRFSATELSEEAGKIIDKYEKQSGEVAFKIFNDGGEDIRSSIKSLELTLVLGILFAVLVVYLFFGSLKTSLIAGCSILLSLLVTLLVMRPMGYTLNVVTLGALIIAVGLITDTSMAVLDSCFQCSGHGISRREAALEGVGNVKRSVLASTMTTIAVCLPVVFMKGLSANLFAPLAYVIMFSAVASLLTAAVFVPLFFVVFRPKEKKDSKVTAVLEKISVYYEKAVCGMSAKKELVLAVTLLLFAVSCAAVIYTDTELLPKSESRTINVNVEFRSGMKSDKIEEKLEVLEELIDSYLDIKDYSMTVQGSSANISLFLKENSKMSCDKFTEDFKEKTKDYAGLDLQISKVFTTSLFEEDDAEKVILSGYQLEEVRAASAELAERYRKIPGVLSVFSSAETEATKVKVEIDSLKAMNYGLTSAEVAQKLRKVVNGQEVMQLDEGGRTYSVYLEFDEDAYATPQDLMNINISSEEGISIPLSELAALEYTDAQECIVRRDGKYLVTLSVTCPEKYREDVEAAMNKAWMKTDSYLGVTKEKDESGRTFEEEFPVLIKAIAAAVFLVFIVLTILFESPKYAVLIMLSIPLGLFGAFILVFVTGSTWNLVTLIGILLLIGIVLNHGIRYTEEADRLSQMMELEEAIVEAGKLRMKPIFMTALVLICAVLPMLFLSGSTGSMMHGMAIVIIGGMFSAAIFVMLLFPIFYLVMYGDNEGKEEEEEELPEIEEIEI